MKSTDVMTREEIRQVVNNLRRRFRRDKAWSTLQLLVVFRLSACCGLRRQEIAWLNVGDVILGGVRPCILIRRSVGKGAKARTVPLWWDKGTRNDLEKWIDYRVSSGASRSDRVVVTIKRTCLAGWSGSNRILEAGSPVEPNYVFKRWKIAIKCLGADRVRQLRCHSGRHTFLTHSLHGGVSLPSVRDAAGHSSVAVTSRYLHALDNPDMPDIFPVD